MPGIKLASIYNLTKIMPTKTDEFARQVRHVSEENRTLTQVSLTLNSQAYSEILLTRPE